MKFWNYLGEFILFRWLFEKLGMYKKENKAPTNGRSDLIDEDSRSYMVNNDYYESDDLDDLDIFLRNNSAREYGNKSDLNSYYSNHHDWSNGNYDQSFDDFHEEQDDYDMMDDF